MSQASPTEDLDTKQARLEHPSGFLYLLQHESVPILIDAILTLPPGREFTKTELADHAGVTRQTVSKYTDLLLEAEVVQRHRLGDRLADPDAYRRGMVADDGVLDRAAPLDLARRVRDWQRRLGEEP
jgi:hypothetical protein